MARFVIVGAGVMGSALCVPLAANGNSIVLVGTPLDKAIIASVKSSRIHPGLQRSLPKTIQALDHDELTPEQIGEADFVILGVSSAGIEWVEHYLAGLGQHIKVLALVTKGLEPGTVTAPQTYAHTLVPMLANRGLRIDAFVGIGGPCIAVEIADKLPTMVVFASEYAHVLSQMRDLMQTDSYSVQLSADVIGVEASAALKNFYAIGVSSMLGRYPSSESVPGSSAKNPVAAAFNQAVKEMAILVGWIGGETATVFDLAGMGDLHVTVGGGRNSRMGIHLGQGMRKQEVLDGPLKNQTVEGLSTAAILAPAVQRGLDAAELDAQSIPFTLSLLSALSEDGDLTVNFNNWTPA